MKADIALRPIRCCIETIYQCSVWFMAKSLFISLE